eukprot:TRINITY_DN26702_c0_g1_i1.p1 TRINITY_DN26702_c0_g1~~TRINITY_DN26702_c0_g1_i1.p1  ORF type:complete len:406 (+),score=1.36 TRINITY_DN26702_c0_g1_i1:182-1219(+)
MHIYAGDEKDEDHVVLKALIAWCEDVVLPALLTTPPAQPDASIIVQISPISTPVAPGRKRKSKVPQAASSLANFVGTFVEQRSKFTEAIAHTVALVMADCVTLDLCSADISAQMCRLIGRMSSNQDADFATQMTPVQFKIISQLIVQDQTKIAVELLDSILQSAPVELLSSPERSQKALRLGELIAIHHQESVLKAIMEKTLPVVVDSIPSPDQEEPDVATSVDDLRPLPAFLVNSYACSAHGVRALAESLSLMVLKAGRDNSEKENHNGGNSEYTSICSSAWKALQIASVVPVKKRTDMSSMTNCLMGIVAKLPANAPAESLQHCKPKPNYLRDIANTLIRKSI